MWYNSLTVLLHQDHQTVETQYTSFINYLQWETLIPQLNICHFEWWWFAKIQYSNWGFLPFFKLTSTVFYAFCSCRSLSISFRMGKSQATKLLDRSVRKASKFPIQRRYNIAREFTLREVYSGKGMVQCTVSCPVSGRYQNFPGQKMHSSVIFVVIFYFRPPKLSYRKKNISTTTWWFWQAFWSRNGRVRSSFVYVSKR